ncbi:macro domain-containing protein [Companilactobacillus jidongensis]|uniref:hypothetical protein n=1 Tax=Companilactobacillus jidongensis TaxID=2486006 RepID=UPI000F782441|nr:hypothetical protein [Companilactobacillus jidongensis]
MGYDSKMDKYFGLLSNTINSNNFDDTAVNFFKDNQKKLNKKFPKTVKFVESCGLIDSISESNVNKDKVLDDYFEAKNIFDAERVSNYDDSKSPHSKITKVEISNHDYAIPKNDYRIYYEDAIVPRSEEIEQLIIDGENDSIRYHTNNGEQTQSFQYHTKFGFDELLDDLDDEISKFDKRNRVISNAFLQIKVSYTNGKRVFYFYKDSSELPTNWKDFTRRIEYYFQDGNLSRNIFDIEPPEKEYLICKVKFNDYGTSYSYLINDEELKVGDQILVPVGASGNKKEVMVDSIGKYTETTSSFPISKMKHVIAKVTKKYDYYNDDQPIINFVNFDEDSLINIKICDMQNVNCDVIVDPVKNSELNNTNSIILTEEHDLPTKNVIHYSNEQDGISPYTKCLDLSKANNFNSIVFPQVLSNEGQQTMDSKVSLAMKEIGKWLDSNEDYKLDILIACDDQRSYDAYSNFVDEYEGDNDYIIETELI